MGSINFQVSSMFGSLSDVIGTKAGLALDRQRLLDTLCRDERFQHYQSLSDDDWVRIESTTFEEMVEFLLYSVGRLERIHNPLPVADVIRKYGKDPAKVEVINYICRAFIDFMKEAMADPKLKRGDGIDPTPFMERCLDEHGRFGLEISDDLITNYAIQLEIKSSHMPEISQWVDVAELDELFKSEGLETQYGQFFDQRFIDYLHRNFGEIDQMNWRKFEGLTAEYFDRQGFQVDLGPGRNDDGIDVRVWPSDKSPESPPAIIVQCKRQKEDVSKVIVKSLYADVLHTNSDSGLVVTTSKLAPGARKVCTVRRYPIEEADRDTVRAWIKEMRKPGLGIAT